MNKTETNCETQKCGEGSACSSCNTGQETPKSDDFHVDTHKENSIKKVIGVISGKGGVGKSLVTSMLAVLARRKGYSVGVMDTDITGPSIPKMFGINKKALGSKEGIYPEHTKEGIKIMSVNLLLDNEDSPVIWRGPLISNVVKQFWSDVVWGDLDYLFLDMPPGTGDVPLTVFQSIPLDGIIVVASPQDLVHLIVRKAYNMAVSMGIPVLGIVENMSYVKCPDCGKEIKLFGDSHIDEIASDLGLKVLAKMAIDPQVAEACDKGEIEKTENNDLIEAMNFIETHFNK